MPPWIVAAATERAQMVWVSLNSAQNWWSFVKLDISSVPNLGKCFNQSPTPTLFKIDAEDTYHLDKDATG